MHLGIVLRLYYTNQEFRVQNQAAWCNLGLLHAYRYGPSIMEGCECHLTSSSWEINSGSSQKQAILKMRTSFPSTLCVPSAPASISTLFCSYKVVSQWQRNKEKKNKRKKEKKQPTPLPNIFSSKKPIDRQILWIPPSAAIFELRTS